MKASPFIKHGTFYFVPIIRQRLSFAILVRRAINLLELNSQDAIAVGLPSSLEQSLLESINQLPNYRVEYLELKSRAEGPRETFPVVPNDALIEAIRSASELQIDYRFIDMELEPTYLTQRRCEANPRWPDDALALEYGAEWYFELIKHFLTQPPLREEPVDTLREQHFADKLRELASQYRKVLVIIDAHNVLGVRRYLRQPAFIENPVSTSKSTWLIKRHKPSPQAALSYLGDIPHLTQQYELSRASSLQNEFNRSEAILKTVLDVAEQTKDMHFGTPRYEAFKHFLQNLMHRTVRVEPLIDTIVLAAAGCFNKAFAERIRYRLLQYGKYTSSHQISTSSPQEHYSNYRTLIEEEKLPHFVQRYCNPTPPTYTTIYTGRDPRNGTRRGGFADYYNLVWPKWVWHVDKMKERVYRLLKARKTEEIRSEKYRGSLGFGIDARRTIRSQFRRRPELWVKHHKYVHRQLPKGNEPVVFIFEIPPPGEEIYYMGSDNGIQGDEFFTYAYRYGPKRKSLSISSLSNVSYSMAHGMVVFTDLQVTLSELRSEFGSALKDRVPISPMTPLPLQIVDNNSWIEQLLHSALDYALDGVICVSPDNWVINQKIIARASAERKVIYNFSLSNFTTEEQRKLKTIYEIPISSMDIPLPADSNDPEFNKKVVERYEFDMREHWG